MRRVAVAMALVVSSCGLAMSSVDITGATVFEDGMTIQLVVDACTREAEALVVEETDELVVVAVSARLRGGDCGLEINATLDSPLGERELIDKHDNESVPVVR